MQVSATSFNEMLKGKRPFPAWVCVRMQELMGYGRELWQKQAEYQWREALNRPAPSPTSSPEPAAAGVK